MSLLIFLAIISVLILIHELGHFFAAKRSGILVEEFGFGLPPRVWGKKIGETVYSINLLPFGGFVRLLGEEGPSFSDQLADSEGENRAFYVQPVLTRVLVTIAGVAMNFLLAVLLFSLIYSLIGIPTKQGYVEIVGVVKDSPAEEAGLKEKDIVKKLKIKNEPSSQPSVEGKLKIDKSEDFIESINQYLGEEVGLEVEREGEDLTVVVIPRKEAPEGEGPLGVVISDTKMVFYPWWQRPLRGAWWGIREAVGWGLMVMGGIGVMLYQWAIKGITPEGVGGPVAIYEVTKMAAQAGWLNVLQFLGILSVNLAVINILPFPALDGGRLLFLGIESFTGKKVKARYERWAHTIGLIILITLMLLITFRDIQRMITGET